MRTRIVFVVALALAASAPAASAQGRQPQKVVLTPSVLKAMTAQKPKAKAPLTARLEVMTRRTARSAGSALPTAVREVPRK